MSNFKEMQAQALKQKQKQSIYHISYRSWAADSYWPDTATSAHVIATDSRQAWVTLRDSLTDADPLRTIHLQDISFVADVDAVQKLITGVSHA